MKYETLIEDPYEGEEDALGRELCEAMGRLRPEREDFARGVAERIDAAGEEIEAGQRVEARVSAFARRAAVFMPPVLLPKGLVKLGAGGAVGGKLSLKFFPGLVAFPVISVLMVLLTLGLGLRAVFGGAPTAQRQDEREAQYATTAWWRRFWLPVLVVLLLSFYCIIKVPGEGLTLLFSVSTLAFLGVFGALAREGLATRREVGRRAASALFWLIGIAIQFSLYPDVTLVGTVARWCVPVVLLSGGFACLFLARRDDPSYGQGRMRAFAGLACLVIFLFIMQLLVTSQRTADVADVREWIETRADVEQVTQMAQVVANLEAAGEPAPDLSHLRAVAREWLDAEYEQGSFNSLYAPALIQLGCFDESDFSHLLDHEGVERVVASRGSGMNIGALLPIVLASTHFEPLGAEASSVIGDKLFTSLDPSDKYTKAEDVQEALRMLEAIGAGERGADLEACAEEVLCAIWAPTESGDLAAFATYRGNIERDEEGRSAEERLTFVWNHSTAVSIWLMDRFGVPGIVDLAALDSHLRQQSIYWENRGISPYVAEAVTARAVLHQLPGWPEAQQRLERTWFQWLLSLRGPLAALLLAGFSVALTLRAPVQRV